MAKMKILKKWNLIINLLFLFYFTMDILPYRIIIDMQLRAKRDMRYFNINIPKFFVTYKYFKIILKDVSCDNRSQDVWLNCDALTYNQVSQDTNPSVRGVYLEKFLFNLTAYREGCSQFNYVILPYRDTLKFWITDSTGKNPSFDTLVTMVIELEPYEI